jgi:hypothetical protein
MQVKQWQGYEGRTDEHGEAAVGHGEGEGEGEMAVNTV